MQFRKYEGLGNDFIVVDTRAWSAEARDLVSPERARTLCDRHFGVGADGVLRLDPAPDADARMRVFNADGSEAEMCGNGLRCVARALSDGRERQGTVTVEVLTGAGRLSATVTSETVEADLGVARDDGRLTLDVDGEVVTGRALDLGNPHFVVDAPNGRDAAARLGPRLQHHPAFPRGVNVSCRSVGNSGSSGCSGCSGGMPPSSASSRRLRTRSSCVIRCALRSFRRSRWFSARLEIDGRLLNERRLAEERLSIAWSSWSRKFTYRNGRDGRLIGFVIQKSRLADKT